MYLGQPNDGNDMVIRINEHGHEYGDHFRYFIEDTEVTEADVLAAEAAGTHEVVQGGSGVVPERLRQPGETREDWINPWLIMKPIKKSNDD